MCSPATSSRLKNLGELADAALADWPWLLPFSQSAPLTRGNTLCTTHAAIPNWNPATSAMIHRHPQQEGNSRLHQTKPTLSSMQRSVLNRHTTPASNHRVAARFISYQSRRPTTAGARCIEWCKRTGPIAARRHTASETVSRCHCQNAPRSARPSQCLSSHC